LVGGYGGPEGWPAMPPGFPAPPGYDYYSGYYCPPYGAYPPGYDYSGYYDYSAYYSQQQQQQPQPPAPDWSSYASGAANYAPPYTGILHSDVCLLVFVKLQHDFAFCFCGSLCELFTLADAVITSDRSFFLYGRLSIHHCGIASS